MGTITSRQRADGTWGHTVQIRIKRGGQVVHSEARTFDRLPAARAWRAKRMLELREPGALDKLRANDPTLAEVIGQYLKESRRDPGKTKQQVLETIAGSDLGALPCSRVDSRAIVAFAQGLGVQPQTVGNYLSHLAAVVRVARPAWGYPLDAQAMDDARVVAGKLGLTSRSRARDRRPTLAELDRLMEHFQTAQARRPDALPMCRLIAFAIFSTRRQEEITRIAWEDLDTDRAEVWVREMKHPGEKAGNDTRVALPSPCLELIALQPRPESGRGPIWPYNSQTISAAFTRACRILGIEDLHFHDLRHEGVSRLFELGWTIPQVATVSGHRTWTSLKRYTHIRQTGDRYAGWPWLARVIGGG